MSKIRGSIDELHVSLTFDATITVDLELIQRRDNLGRVCVVVVRPRSNRIAANVSVRNTVLLEQASDSALVFVHIKPRLHRISSIYVVSKLRWQKSLVHIKYLTFIYPITK